MNKFTKNSPPQSGAVPSLQSEEEMSSRADLREFCDQILPRVPSDYWDQVLPLFLRRQTLSRLLWLAEIYQLALPVPGIVCEFGVFWGASTSVFVNLRGIFEPYNHSRRVVGFDSFEGFPEPGIKDGASIQQGMFATTENHMEDLAKILRIHESSAPLNHIQKHHLIQGDVSETVRRWSDDNEHVVVALAFFDLDLYRPTRDVLELLKPHLTKGSIIVFDEFGHDAFPGEAAAVGEVLGFDRIELRRSTLHPTAAWLRIS